VVSFNLGHLVASCNRLQRSLLHHIPSNKISICILYWWVMTGDGCVHTADTTQLDVGAGGVYWA